MSEINSTTVTVSHDGPLGYLTLTDPRRRNALSTSTMQAATTALREFDRDQGVRVVVVRAEGPAFSAGHDLTELVDRTLDDEEAVFATCVELMTTIHEIRQPVIAQVAGWRIS